MHNIYPLLKQNQAKIEKFLSGNHAASIKTMWRLHSSAEDPDPARSADFWPAGSRSGIFFFSLYPDPTRNNGYIILFSS